MTPEHLVPPDLLAIMQCPACGGTLSERKEPPALVCAECGRAYPVRDGIPVMLIDEADDTAPGTRLESLDD